MSKDLYKETLRLAKDSNEDVHQICDRAAVGLRWYHKLLAGQIRDPGVRRVQRLHDYLAFGVIAAESTEEHGQQKGAA